MATTGQFHTLIAGGVLAVAIAMTGMPALQAEEKTPEPARPALPAPIERIEPSITLTGCLLLGPYGDFTLSRAVVTGTILQQVAWKLDGGKDLLGHILEKVEVTGAMLPMPPDTPLLGSGRPADRAEYRLRVKTIKKVLGGCS